MSEGKKKMDPFQLIALLVIVGSIFAGLYYTNMVMVTRLDGLETTVSGNSTALETIIERLDRKVDSLGQSARNATEANEVAPPEGESAAEGEAVADADEKADPATAEGEAPAEADDAAPTAKDAAGKEAVKAKGEALAKADKKAPPKAAKATE